MSISETVSIDCGSCGESYTAQRWDSLNSDLNPQEKKLLIEGRLFKAVCPKCGFEHTLNYSMLYHDMTHGVIIQYISEKNNVEQAHAEPKPKLGLAAQSVLNDVNSLFPGAASKTDGYQIRIVTHHDELREKAMIFDCGFDDRIIEITKGEYFLAFSEQQPDLLADLNAMFFEKGSAEPYFNIITISGSNNTLPFDIVSYEHTAELFKDKLKAESSADCYIVDMEWAARFIEKATAALKHAADNYSSSECQFTIRLMKNTDYKAVYALWRKTPGIGLNDIDDSYKGITRYLERNPRTCFVAEANGELVGAILAGHDGRRGYIYHACVDKANWGKHIGKRLTKASLKALINEGISKTAMVVFAHNERGNGFWERMGFCARADLVYRDKALIELERTE